MSFDPAVLMRESPEEIREACEKVALAHNLSRAEQAGLLEEHFSENPPERFYHANSLTNKINKGTRVGNSDSEKEPVVKIWGRSYWITEKPSGVYAVAWNEKIFLGKDPEQIRKSLRNLRLPFHKDISQTAEEFPENLIHMSNIPASCFYSL